MSAAPAPPTPPEPGSAKARKSKRPKRPGAPRLEVHVSKEIIDAAEQRDSSHCMIAEAVRAAVPGARSVSVDLQTIRFSDPAKRLRYVYLTPRMAQVALVLFDQGKHNDPFTMLLRNAQVVKMGDPMAPRDPKAPRMPEGATVEFRQPQHASPLGVPAVVGGKTPPTAALTNTVYKGKRRAFGLRLLKY